jgi:hypothetical protein
VLIAIEKLLARTTISTAWAVCSTVRPMFQMRRLVAWRSVSSITTDDRSGLGVPDVAC